MAEVAAVVVTSSSVVIHTRLLSEAARYGVGLVVCNPFKSASVILPPNRCTNTAVTRAQADLPTHVRERLWRMTVDAKVMNQVSLARNLAPGHPSLPELELCEARRELGKKTEAARIFWDLFDEIVARRAQVREARPAGGLIQLLRYGTTLLLSAMLRACFSAEINPTFGIRPLICAQTVPLAYDLLEPFRPCAHARVAQWVFDHPDLEAWEVSEAFRRYIAGCVDLEVRHMGAVLSLYQCIQAVVHSFQTAVLEQNSAAYKPWIQSNASWIRGRR